MHSETRCTYRLSCAAEGVTDPYVNASIQCNISDMLYIHAHIYLHNCKCFIFNMEHLVWGCYFFLSGNQVLHCWLTFSINSILFSAPQSTLLRAAAAELGRMVPLQAQLQLAQHLAQPYCRATLWQRGVWKQKYCLIWAAMLFPIIPCSVLKLLHIYVFNSGYKNKYHEYKHSHCNPKYIPSSCSPAPSPSSTKIKLLQTPHVEAHSDSSQHKRNYCKPAQAAAKSTGQPWAPCEQRGMGKAGPRGGWEMLVLVQQAGGIPFEK